MRIRQSKYVAKSDKENVIMEDFTIEVDNIPIIPNVIYDDELKEFFENCSIPGKKTPIADINLCFSLEKE
jgi:hypothetical protein